MQPNHHGVDVFIDTLISIVNKMGGSTDKKDALSFLFKKRTKLNEYNIQLIAGVSKTLAHLAQKYSCVFYSQGQPEIQQKKLTNSKLDIHFSDIFITPIKSKELLAAYLENRKIIIEAVTVVGNSPRYDINPAKALGIKSIYINSPYTWERDKEKLLDAGPATVVISKFEELADIFEQK